MQYPTLDMGNTGPTGDHPVPGVSIPYSTSFSLAQIYSLLIANGATASAAAALTQISTREDGSGKVNIVNDTPGSGDYSVGFFQLNLLSGVNGHIMQSRDFGNGQVYSAEQLAANPNAQAKAAIALWNNGKGAGNWTPSYLGPQATWQTNTHPELSGPAISTVGNDAVAIANGALALVGLPPIDPSVPPQNPASPNSSGTATNPDGSATTDTGTGGTTTNTSGLGAGEVQIGELLGQPVSIPPGMVLAALAVVLLILGAILFLANNQSVKVDAVKGVTSNPGVQLASKVIP